MHGHMMEFISIRALWDGQSYRSGVRYLLDPEKEQIINNYFNCFSFLEEIYLSR